MFHMDVACEPSFQSPTIEEYSLYTLSGCNSVFIVSPQLICSFASLFPACYKYIVFNLVSIWKWSVIKFPEFQDAKSNKKNSAHVMDTSVNQETSMMSQDSSSSDQEMEVQIPQCFPSSTSQQQPFMQPMFTPYIKGPKMDLTVNDSLYCRFLKWKPKV